MSQPKLVDVVIIIPATKEERLIKIVNAPYRRHQFDIDRISIAVRSRVFNSLDLVHQ